jgi:hypothetical protein
MGIGYPIEQQQEGGLGQPLEQVLEVGRSRGCFDACHDALMASIAGKARQARVVDGNDAHAAGIRQGCETTQTRVATPGIDVDLAHAVGLVAQPCSHRVKTNQQAVLACHA